MSNDAVWSLNTRRHCPTRVDRRKEVAPVIYLSLKLDGWGRTKKKRRKSEGQSCSSSQASAVQAKKRQVLAGFLPYSAHFFCIFTLSTHIQNQFCKKIRSGLHFLAAVEAQSFCLNSGRVATAYSTDKYKYQNHENRSQLSRAIY